MTLYYESDYITLYHGDCLEILPILDDGAVDAIITDPPYPHIKRDYGFWTEDEWFDMMIPVCEQSKRILTPQGSAVYILQPNSRKVGSMRKWLWEFMVYICDEWNLIQDAYWWNLLAMPSVGTRRDIGLMRPSVKTCVWAGSSDAYRSQESVLWKESDRGRAMSTARRIRTPVGRESYISGHSADVDSMLNVPAERGGVTPYNIIPLGNSRGRAGSKHASGTPPRLTDWWTGYIVPFNGVILDMFVGAGTMVEAGIRQGHHVIGIDKEEQYLDMVIDRCEPIEEKLLEGIL